MKLYKFVLISVLLIVIINLVSSANIDLEVYENLENSNLTRVIIRKNNELSIFSPLNFLRLNKLNEENFGLREDQVKYDYDDYIVAFIDSNDLEELKNNPSVKSIEKEMVFHTLLQNATVIQNATSAWNLEKDGINLTGAGQTVCIIDTGINYNHPDLGGCYGENNPDSECKVIGGWDFCANDDNECSGEDNNPINTLGWHGTHVAGIVSASGNIYGIAPESKIVAIKAGNSDGRLQQIDILDGLKWCINNASKFNISVISMSLGSMNDFFDKHCDNAIPELKLFTTLINNAVNKNISVVISSGNNYTDVPLGISFPSCISKAIPVSSVNKLGAISEFANRNSLVRLMAIGTSVNSTNIGSNYKISSGTSMSAPMVSGAILIINQYLKLSGQSKTPSEIENILYNTGINITEGNVNYSRIDVYSALLHLDVDPPVFTYLYPLNNTISKENNISFYVNVSDWQLKNVSLNIYNSDGLMFKDYSNVSGAENYSNFTLNLYPDNYVWNIVAFDENNNSNTSSNYSLFINSMDIDLSPENNTRKNAPENTFSCYTNLNPYSNLSLKNTSINIYNSTDLVFSNYSNVSGVENYSSFDYTFSEEGEYLWNCISFDNDSNMAFSENYTFVYETVSPSIINLSSKIYYSRLEIYIDFDEHVNYSISNESILNYSDEFKKSHEIFIDNLSANTKYSFNISFYDIAGNFNYSIFNVTTAPLFTKQLTPEDDFHTNETDIIFTCFLNSSSEYDLKNVTFLLYDKLFELIEENSTGFVDEIYTYHFDVNIPDEGVYYWSCLVYNEKDEYMFSETNYTINVDYTSPELNVSYTNTSSSINLNISSNELVNYEITGDLSKKVLDYSNSHGVIFKDLLAGSNYNFNVNICDKAGNCNITSLSIDLERKTEKSTQVSLAGGPIQKIEPPAIGTISNPIVLEKNIYYSGTIKQNTKLHFLISNSLAHSIEFKNIVNNSATIEINSEPILLTMKEGELVKLNITNANYYDFVLKLNKINTDNISVTFYEIYESIVEKKVDIVNTTKNDSMDVPSNWPWKFEFEFPKFDKYDYYKIISLSLILVAIRLILFFRNRDKRNMKYYKSKNVLKKRLDKKSFSVTFL